MCLLSSRRSSIVSVMRDLSAVSVDFWPWSPHRLLSPPLLLFWIFRVLHLRAQMVSGVAVRVAFIH